MNNNRDINIINRIIEYSNEIDKTVECFGDNFDTFDNNTIYRNAVYYKLVNWRAY